MAVSFYCVITVKKDYKQYTQLPQNSLQKDSSEKGILKQWAKSVWNKKKVYLQLILHLFDQATDLGVTYEYWTLRNESDIGINTMYLFVISIFVIVSHRIISSFAMYQLTKKTEQF